MKMKVLLAAAATLSLAGAVQSASAATTIFTENFSSSTPGANWGGNANFTVTGGAVDVVGDSYYPLCGAGNNCLDLDGTMGNGLDPAGQLTSTYAFGVGSYEVTFLLGGNARGYGDRTTKFQLGDQFFDVGPLASGDGLASFTLNFYNTVAGANLVITQYGPSNQQGNLIDDITVSAVPEPATWAMMIIGFGAAGSMVRSNRRRLALAA